MTKLFEIRREMSTSNIIGGSQNISMPRRNKMVLLLSLPIVVILWFIGWSLMWVGQSRRQLNKAESLNQAALSFVVDMPEVKHLRAE